MLEQARRFGCAWLSASVLILVQSVSAFGQVGLHSGTWVFTESAPHHRAIVQVESSTGIGTGVIIRVDTNKPAAGGFLGYGLTAYHVIENSRHDDSIRVVYQNGRRAKRCRVVEFDKENDIALLWVWVPEGIPAAAVASKPAKHGDELEIAGLGGGSDLECCIRHFKTRATFPTNERAIFADTVLLPGDSGGPVFNEQHQVVGVVSGGWFWFETEVAEDDGGKRQSTWPARLCNAGPIQNLLAKLEP